MAKKRKPAPKPKPAASSSPPSEYEGDEEAASPPPAEIPSEPQDADQAMARMTAAFADLMGSDDSQEEDAPPTESVEVDPGRRTAPMGRPSERSPAGPPPEAIAGRTGPRSGASSRTANRPSAPPEPGGTDAPSHFWENESEPLPPEGEVSVAGVVEAMLFVGQAKNEPLLAATVAGLVRGVEPEDVAAVVAELNASYERRRKPYLILEERGGWRLALRDEYGSIRARFYGRLRTVRLSQAAVETLSVVAYLQPVPADEVNRLRGGNSASILNQLVRRELLAVERSPEAPRKVRYRTTPRFLKLFHLDSIHDLPKSQDVDER